MATVTDDAQQKIDAYLAVLRKRLRGIDEQDVCEIIEELRSHILDRASVSGEVTATGVGATLGALGSPEQLATEYLIDNRLKMAEATRSPVRILEILFRWASLSAAGVFVFLGSIVGYFLGATFIFCALLKPIHPRTAGLWILSSGSENFTVSLRLGFSNAPPEGRELLGWWIVPIGLVLGCGLVMLTTRFGLWCVRQYRKSRISRTGRRALRTGSHE